MSKKAENADGEAAAATPQNVTDVEKLAGEFTPPPADTTTALPPPPVPMRREILVAPCAKLWRAGCAQAASFTDVPQLEASEEERQTVGEALATIADLLLPENVDPNSKAGQVVAAGAVLYMTVQAKVLIYKAVQAEREAAEQKAARGQNDAAA